MRWLLVLALVAGCVSAKQETGVVVIRDDFGGNLLEYSARRDALKSADRVEIRGKCHSACTIFYSLPNACLGSGARLGFHSASVSIGPAGDDQMGRHYRGEIRERFNAEWRHSRKIVELRAADVVAMDPRAKLCGAAR